VPLQPAAERIEKAVAGAEQAEGAPSSQPRMVWAEEIQLREHQWEAVEGKGARAGNTAPEEQSDDCRQGSWAGRILDRTGMRGQPSGLRALQPG
jgi:hypothetical protein